MKVFRDLFRDFRFSVSFIVLVIIVILALLSIFSPYDPTLWNVVPKDMRPSAEHWLGTDSNGQDIFWQATFAVRNSLIISLIAALVSRVIAILVGMVAGYVGGATDRILMFISDGLLVIPIFLIFVMLAMLMRKYMNLVILGLMLSLLSWPWDARLIRSMILSLREREFTKTAILSGTGTVKLVLNEYMPFTMPKVKMTIPVVAHSMTPVYVAQTRGFFADEKLDLNITSTGGGGPDIRALIAGDVEFSFTTGDNVILAHQEGKRLVMVSSGLNKVFINWAMHKEAAKAKGITESMPLAEKIKALKGLTVGVTNPGALTAHLAAFVIRKAGYTPQQDVQIIPIGAGPTWLAALENRKIDVALTAPPVPETAISRGYAIMFINNARGEDPSIPEFLMENLVARPETVQKEPELVRRMVRALVRANQWALKSTPEQVADALKPFMAKIEPELLLSGARSVIPALSPDGRTSERNFTVTQEVLEQAGILKKRSPYVELVTNDYLPK